MIDCVIGWMEDEVHWIGADTDNYLLSHVMSKIVIVQKMIWCVGCNNYQQAFKTYLHHHPVSAASKQTI